MSRFLFSYRNTPHSSTQECPSALIFKKRPTTRLSLLQPSFAASKQLSQLDESISAPRCFVPGDEAMVFNARRDGPKWYPAAVMSRLGPVSYSVQSGRGTRHVHIDHLLARNSTTPTSMSEPSHVSVPLVVPPPNVCSPPASSNVPADSMSSSARDTANTSLQPPGQVLQSPHPNAASSADVPDSSIAAKPARTVTRRKRLIEEM